MVLILLFDKTEIINITNNTAHVLVSFLEETLIVLHTEWLVVFGLLQKKYKMGTLQARSVFPKSEKLVI